MDDPFANPETHLMHLNIIFLLQEDHAGSPHYLSLMSHSLPAQNLWRGYRIHNLSYFLF